VPALRQNPAGRSPPGAVSQIGEVYKRSIMPLLHRFNGLEEAPFKLFVESRERCFEPSTIFLAICLESGVHPLSFLVARPFSHGLLQPLASLII
jgi:hypothetical protein